MQIRNLKVDGGASANDFLMQFQADLLQGSVIRSACNETTAKGAAYLAGLACGMWKDTEELAAMYQAGQTFVSKMPFEKRNQCVRQWHRAVERARNWAEEESK